MPKPKAGSCPADDLLERAAVGDTLSGELAAHLRGCAACQSRLAELRATNTSFGRAAEMDSTRNARPDESNAPQQIAGYRILGVLGEGGMGVVHRAEQREPFRREVALKLIKPGMDSRHVVSRFEAERQALAYMNHPNIARVFDGGATESGRLYFVMELVKGEPLTTFCDRNRLSIDARLRVFLDICDAVQHAHTKGVVHRDLKPSNLLVAFDSAGRPQPKVIDFGVAKALHQPLTDGTLFTESGQIIGTPEYMSPEQAGLSGADIDTRSDVYSLGVILHELLIGVRPFEVDMARRAEVVRLIRETEPLKPSTRWASLVSSVRAKPRPAGSSSKAPDLVSKILHARRSDAGSLTALLRRDLDWVVMKCLEKDRERRYETVDALAMELRRYLANEPVLAGPPSAAYRLQKFLRRNRNFVTAVALVVLALGMGLTGTTHGLLRAEARRKEADEAGRSMARVVDFMEDALLAARPGVALGRDTALMQDVMKRASQRIGAGELTNEPLAELRLRSAIGNCLRQLRDYESAGGMLQAAVGLASRLNGSASRATLAARLDHAQLLHDERKSAQARDEYLDVLKSLEVREDDVDLRARCLGGLAESLASLGDVNAALEYGERALATRRSLPDDDRYELARTLHQVGMCYRLTARPADALAAFDESLKILESLFGQDHPDTSSVMNEYAEALGESGRFDEALALSHRAVEIDRRIYSAGHPKLADSIEDLADLELHAGRPQTALPLYLESLEIWKLAFPDHNLNVAHALALLSDCQRRLGNFPAALQSGTEALEIARRESAGDHQVLAAAVNSVAVSLRALGRGEEARPLLKESYDIKRRLYPGDHPDLALTLHNLSVCDRSLGRIEDALSNARSSLEMYQRLAPGGSEDVADELGQVGSCLSQLGRHSEAIEQLEAGLQMFRRALPADHPSVARASLMLGNALIRAGRAAEGLPLCQEALRVRRQQMPARHPDVIDARLVVVDGLIQIRKLVEAEAELDAAREFLDAAGPSSVFTGRYLRLCFELEDWFGRDEPGGDHAAKAAQARARFDAWRASTQPASRPAAGSEAGASQK